jgi:hypothetical protein
MTNLFTKSVVLLCDSEGKQGYGQQGLGDWLWATRQQQQQGGTVGQKAPTTSWPWEHKGWSNNNTRLRARWKYAEGYNTKRQQGRGAIVGP